MSNCAATNSAARRGRSAKSGGAPGTIGRTVFHPPSLLVLWEGKDDTYGSPRLAVVAEIHATNFLSSLVHEGVADFMSRSALCTGFPLLWLALAYFCA